MRVVCLSDTHTFHRELKLPQKCSVVVHTGDFSHGKENQTDDFLVWFSELPIKHKILIAGNHDWYAFYNDEHFKIKCALLGITYLNEESVTIEGIKFYGTPWVPQFYNWAFMEEEHELVERYDKIPEDTQVLLTHGPAQYTLDFCSGGHVGSEALYHRLKELPNLTHHIFGHIHEGAGKVQEDNLTSINASCVTTWYSTIDKPITTIIKPTLI